MPPPARNTHHPQTSSRIRTTLSNRYRQNVTTKHGRQEHKQSITKSNHRDIAGISKSESQQPYNKGGLLKTTRWTHNSARTASPGVRALYYLIFFSSHGSDPYLSFMIFVSASDVFRSVLDFPHSESPYPVFGSFHSAEIIL